MSLVMGRVGVAARVVVVKLVLSQEMRSRFLFLKFF